MTTVISNAGPLIALGKLNRLELLADLYETVQIPQSVSSVLLCSVLMVFSNSDL
jgi:predicted nucleic acid-binding protein